MNVLTNRFNYEEATIQTKDNPGNTWIEDLENKIAKSHDQELRLKRQRRAQRTAAAAVACRVAHAAS